MRNIDDLVGVAGQKIIDFSHRSGYKLAELASTDRKRIGDKIRGIFTPPQPSAEPTSPEPLVETRPVEAEKILQIEVHETLIGKADRPVAEQRDGGGDKIFSIRNGVVLVDGMGGMGDDVNAGIICGEAAQTNFNNKAKLLLEKNTDLQEQEVEGLQQLLEESIRAGGLAMVEAKRSGKLQIGADATINISVIFRFRGKSFIMSAVRGDSPAWLYDPSSGTVKRITQDQSLIPAGTPEQDTYDRNDLLKIRNITTGAADLIKGKPGALFAGQVNLSVDEVPPGWSVLVTSDGFGDNAHPTLRQKWLKEAAEKGLKPNQLQHFLLEKAQVVEQLAAKSVASKPAYAKEDDLSIASLTPEIVFYRGPVVKHEEEEIWFSADQNFFSIQTFDKTGKRMTRTEQIEEANLFLTENRRQTVPKFDQATGRELSEDERWNLLLMIRDTGYNKPS